MVGKNPYAISFGRIPAQYIGRTIIIDEIVETIESEQISEQAFKLTGIRGTGKTVTLTAVEKKLKNNHDVIVVGLRSNGDIISDLIAHLYSSVPFLTDFINAELNLSAFGIGMTMTRNAPTASLDYALKKIMGAVRKRNKKVVVTIDEARNTSAMVDFIQLFQILIREDFPIYLVVAGLYEDIEDLENTDGLTFFMRACTYKMTPLSLRMIREDYMKTIGVPEKLATEMAVLTKGYAFAYQALGKYMWEAEEKALNDSVLFALDDALSEKVYKKIWSELAPKDKWYMQFLVTKEQMAASELLELTKTRHNEWSEPRRRLSAKGIIDTSMRGMIQINLPRMKEFVEDQLM